MCSEFRSDSVVIGAGVIGLAIAAELAKSGIEVTVLEQAKYFGTGTSSRNSEVLHAGVYYDKDSLKAKHCVAGIKMLYKYLSKRSIPHKKTGKLIVATKPSELKTLAIIAKKAQSNGVESLQNISASKLKTLEPEVSAYEALYSPETGIFDSHAFMLSLVGDVGEAKGAIAYGQKVVEVYRQKAEFVVISEDSTSQRVRIVTPRLVNAAGHGVVEIAKRTEGFENSRIPKQRFAKGTYMKLSGKSPFRHLIYPAPVPGALGIHSTIDLSGGTRFGPDIEWTSEQDLTPSKKNIERFYNSIRAYWPNLPDGAIEPDFCGSRPKIEKNGVIHEDFLIETSAEHGLDGHVALFGIESPGLTSALSIAKEVTEMLV